MQTTPVAMDYRRTAALTCAGCGSNAGDDHTFSKSGDVLCRGCADRQSLQASSSLAEVGDGDLAGERRCGCGGVASAGKMIDHAAVQRMAYGLVKDRIDMGSETVFACGSCGKSFALLNRLRRVRLSVRALQVGVAALGAGFIAFAVVSGALGVVAGAALTLFIGWLGARALINDALLRRRHPPIR